MNQRLDIIGIGLGPSNLSLAALGSEIEGFTGQFWNANPISPGTGDDRRIAACRPTFKRPGERGCPNQPVQLSQLSGNKQEVLPFPDHGTAHRIA